MKVDFSAVQTSQIFKSAHISNAEKQNGTTKQKQIKQDRVSISGKGKADNMIKGLQKQKQALMQRKSEVRAKALEEGKSVQEVNTLIESYDMQIKNIDTQIAKIQTEQAEKTTKPKEYNKNTLKTKEQVEKQKLASLTELSVNAEQADTMYSVKNSVDREARTLSSEIAMDKSYNIGQDFIDKKEENLSQLEQKSQQLMEDVGEKLVEVQQIANDNIKAEANVVEEEKETTTEKIQQQSEEAEQTQQTENE
jgi:hypothetical protein